MFTPTIRNRVVPDTPMQWSPPPYGVFKINFDGASRGNPNQAGFGGIFRNSKGEIQNIYYGSIGWDTNNSAELEGLWQGLCLTLHYNFFQIIIEGEYQVLINMVKQLLRGTNPAKVAHNWRLAARIDRICNWLQSNREISFTHVKHEGNKVVDLLANIGTDSTITFTHGPLTIIHEEEMLQNCTMLVHKDCSFPNADAGVA